MATETQKPTDRTPKIEIPKKTQTLTLATPNPLDLNLDSSKSDQNPNSSVDGDEKKNGDASKGSTTAIVSPTGGTANAIEKKMKRAERFGVPVQMSEEEKRNSRSERFCHLISSMEGLDKKYKVIKKLGSGQFGDVYKCFDSDAGHDVAVKCIEIPNRFDGLPSSILREISILSAAKHENILRLIEWCWGDGKMYIVLEMLVYDLSVLIRDEILDLNEIKRIMCDILSGLNYLHGLEIVHRDLCPCNILVNEEKKMKIADFGLARFASTLVESYTHTECTYEYTAPEQLLRAPYSYPVDIWAAGCIFAELVTRENLFSYNKELSSLAHISRVLGTPDATTWPDVVCHAPSIRSMEHYAGEGLESAVQGLDSCGLDLLSRMLVWDPSQRITAQMALEHPFLCDTRKSS